MDLLSTKEASKYLKIDSNTLWTWRDQRKGPRFIRVGRLIKYSREDLDAYLKKNTVKT